MAYITALDSFPNYEDYKNLGSVAYANAVRSWLADLITFQTEANAQRDEVNSSRDEAVSSKNIAVSAKDAAIIAKDAAELAKVLSEDAWAAIQTYVIPTEATYNYQEIDSKIAQSTQITKPAIISPTNGAIDFIGEVTTDAYTTSESYQGTQDFARWKATNLDGSIVYDSYEGASNLTSWTPSIGLPLTDVYVSMQKGSDGHRSQYCPTISFTTPNIFIETPTIEVTGTPSDVPETPTLTTSAFSVFNGTDTHVSTTFTVKDNLGTVLWTETKTTGDLLTTTVPSGILAISTAYTFEAFHTGATYGNSSAVIVSGTTKAQFTPTAGTQGEWGFGIAPTDQPFAALGLAEMTGTNTYGHDNYGNYIHSNGSVVCWHPKTFIRVGSASSPRYATYGKNAIDVVGTETFANEAEANAAGYFLPRVFINNGTEQAGFFMDKYKNSKHADNAQSVSVFGGNPISLTTNTSYTRSSTMTGCTGILADAVTISRARGTRWNAATAFMYGYKFLLSIAHGQAVTDAADCAWYDGTLTTNYPKGCNDNALGDVDDATVAYTSSPDTAAKPLAGATANFNKTTCNGCANGVADLNGGTFEITIGITAAGTSATSDTVISNDNIYVLKEATDHATLTSGWNSTTDAWGDTTHLATLYDIVVSPHALGSANGSVYWGNSTNALFSNDQSGVNRDVCGFIPKDNTSTDATGINMAGNDRIDRYNRHNLVPCACGNWTNTAAAGFGFRYFYNGRINDSTTTGFRASAYVN